MVLKFFKKKMKGYTNYKSQKKTFEKVLLSTKQLKVFLV